MFTIGGRALNKLGGSTNLLNLIKLRMPVSINVADRLWVLRSIVKREKAQTAI